MNEQSVSKSEIKKALYKQNPRAKLIFIDKNAIRYATTIENEGVILFNIPLNDIETGKFYSEMEAKHLIRWME